MTDSTLILARLAEEFSSRLRNGESPDHEEYARAHPDLAERIRQLFPTLVLLEQLSGAAECSIKAQTTLEPGDVLGAYRIVRELGRGGMGVVYEATHLSLGKRVALKVLSSRGSETSAQLERFLREARTAASLHHTHIVPVFDAGEVAGAPYFAMDYVEGVGLDRVLAEGSLPAAESMALFQWAARLGAQAASGLAHANGRGVIHRDVKPSNLLLDDHGNLWISDFGLARRDADPALTQTGAVLGTPRYMSPEQIKATEDGIDHRTDIYSLGVTLYELLTRRPPFGGETPHEVLASILERDPLPPRRLAPSIPRDLETIVLKAMAKRREDRYPSAALLEDDLRRWSRNEPIQARRIGPLGRLVRWCRRNPKLGAVTAAAASIIVALTLVYYRTLRLENERTLAALDRETQATRESRAATERAHDHLARSYFEQARAVRSSGQPGRRWQSLDLLERAELLRRRERETSGGGPSVAAEESALPRISELRSEAVASAMIEDARVLFAAGTFRGSLLPSLSQNGRFAATMRFDPKGGTVRVLDLDEGRTLLELDDPRAMGTLALSRDGRRLAASQLYTGAMSLFEVPQGTAFELDVVHSGSQPSILERMQNRSMPLRNASLVDLGPGDRLAAVKDQRAFVFDKSEEIFSVELPPGLAWISFDSEWSLCAYPSAPDRLAIRTIESDELRELSLPVTLQERAVFHPKRPFIALPCRTNEGAGAVMVWDFESDRSVTLLQVGLWPSAVAFDAEGKKLAVGDGTGDLHIVDVGSGLHVAHLSRAHDGVVLIVRWDPERPRLTTAGLDGTVKRWELAFEERLSSFSAGSILCGAIGVGQGGRLIAVAEPRPEARIALIDRTTGQRRVFEDRGAFVSTVEVSRDGRRVLAASRSQVTLFDVETQAAVSKLEDARDFFSAAFTPEGRALASGMKHDIRLAIFDVASGEVVFEVPAGAQIAQLDPTGTFVATASAMSPLIEIFRIGEGEPFRRIELEGIELASDLAIGFGPGGKYLSVLRYLGAPERGDGAGDHEGERDVVEIFALENGERVLRVPHRKAAERFAFSHDETLLAVAYQGGLIQIFDLAVREEIFSFESGTTSIRDLAFAEDDLLFSDAVSGRLYALSVGGLKEDLEAIGLGW